MTFDVVMAHTYRADLTRLVISNIPVDFLVILIDNSSHHEMQDIVMFRENISYVKQPYPSSVAQAYNLGVACTESEWALMTPNDILYNPFWLLHVKNNLERLTEGIKFLRSRNGYNGLYHIPTVRELEGFDEGMPLWGGEDVDFLYRLCLAGHKWFWNDRLYGIHLGSGYHMKEKQWEWPPNVPERKKVTFDGKWMDQWVEMKRVIVGGKRGKL
jgi:hypothetical protein